MDRSQCLNFRKGLGKEKHVLFPKAAVCGKFCEKGNKNPPNALDKGLLGDDCNSAGNVERIRNTDVYLSLHKELN